MGSAFLCRRHKNAPRSAYALAQLHGVYILAQNEAGLVLVDMHAAHERIVMERLKSNLDAGRVERQSLLVPALFAPKRSKVAAAEREPRGARASRPRDERCRTERIAVRAAPVLLAGGDVVGLAAASCKELREFRRRAGLFKRQEPELLATMACHCRRARQPAAVDREYERAARDIGGNRALGHLQPCRPTWYQLTLARSRQAVPRGR